MSWHGEPFPSHQKQVQKWSTVEMENYTICYVLSATPAEVEKVRAHHLSCLNRLASFFPVLRPLLPVLHHQPCMTCLAQNLQARRAAQRSFFERQHPINCVRVEEVSAWLGGKLFDQPGVSKGSCTCTTSWGMPNQGSGSSATATHCFLLLLLLRVTRLLLFTLLLLPPPPAAFFFGISCLVRALALDRLFGGRRAGRVGEKCTITMSHSNQRSTCSEIEVQVGGGSGTQAGTPWNRNLSPASTLQPNSQPNAAIRVPQLRL